MSEAVPIFLMYLHLAKTYHVTKAWIRYKNNWLKVSMHLQAEVCMQVQRNVFVNMMSKGGKDLKQRNTLFGERAQRWQNMTKTEMLEFGTKIDKGFLAKLAWKNIEVSLSTWQRGGEFCSRKHLSWRGTPSLAYLPFSFLSFIIVNTEQYKANKGSWTYEKLQKV